MDEKRRKRIVDNEIRRLNSILKDVDGKKKRTVRGLIDEAAFMKATLTELKEILSENGVIDLMPQGDYSILREHPALKSYNSTIQRYTTIVDKLLSLLPKETAKTEDGLSDLIDFLNDRDE